MSYIKASINRKKNHIDTCYKVHISITFFFKVYKFVRSHKFYFAHRIFHATSPSWIPKRHVNCNWILSLEKDWLPRVYWRFISKSWNMARTLKSIFLLLRSLPNNTIQMLTVQKAWARRITTNLKEETIKIQLISSKNK